LDDVASNISHTLDVGVVTRRGAYYSYNGENLGQGRAKSMDKLVEEPAIMEAIEADVRRVIAERQGLPHFSAQPEPFLTQHTLWIPPYIPEHPLSTP
jgi:hypothetical protein